MLNARQMAFEALLAWKQKGIFLWDSFEIFKQRYHLEKRELDFAYELSCQTARLYGYLEHSAKRIAQNLPKKLKERLVLYLGLYQRLFLKNIPVYAVVDSSVELAKKYCSASFAKFINAVLRKDVLQPDPAEVASLSFPEFFKTSLEKQYGKAKALELLIQLNEPSKKMASTFEDGKIENRAYDEYPKNGYIQNATPVLLVQTLAKSLKNSPKKILDLCAAPGGKTILLAHLFPEAHIEAFDLRPKLAVLKENLDRFAPSVTITESFSTYDLILVDAPCSNSGVLYKCPEARWRLSEESLSELEELQTSLVNKALEHLLPGGHLWYMTCSILQQENEAFIHKLNLPIVQTVLQLPDTSGKEGGFAACLAKPP